MWRKLDGSGASADEVGGKGAALDRLVAADAPVPPATAITVEAYRTFVEAAGLRPFLEQLPDRIEPTEIDDDADRVDEAFLKAPLPESVADAIHAAFDNGSRGHSVAVRSSATTEDLADASFAGQHRSFLGVGPDDLEDAVRRCWASLWAPGVRAYRSAQDIEGGDPEMAVVIQQMVPAERSGVVFTIDPTGEEPGTIRVEIVEGLGEHLVSGHTTPDVYHLRREDLALREHHGPRLLRELGQMSLAIEDAFGRPQDIEWSAAAGRIYILQSRPITATGDRLDDGFDTPATSSARFTSEGVVEMLPGVLPPLLWTINAPLLERGFTSLFADLGVEPRGAGAAETAGPMIARFRGRPALNLSRLGTAARRMPGGSTAEVEHQYLGRTITDEEEPASRWRDRLGRILPAWRAIRMRKRLVRDADVFERAAELAVALEPDYRSTPTASLVAYRHRLRDLARIGVRTEVAVAASAAANYRALEMSLERWLEPGEVSLAAQRLTAGEVAGRGGRDIVDERLRHSASAALYAGRTWEEESDALSPGLRRRRARDRDAGTDADQDASARAGGADARGELEARLTRTRRWRMTRVLTGQVVDVRRRLLRRTIDDAIRFLHLREAMKAAVLLVGGEERRVIRELAERLRAAGTFEAEDDEWFVSDEELDRLATGETAVSTAMIAHRREMFAAMLDGPPLPALFTGAPSSEEESGAQGEGPVLSGWATSPGRVEGRARVVRGLADGRDLEDGEILVGRSSDPSWTPLFLGAGAVVMEQGGPLSHAAIVARELGLPAVLNVKGATRRLRTGMTVAVDGTAGSVEIVDDGKEVA